MVKAAQAMACNLQHDALAACQFGFMTWTLGIPSCDEHYNMLFCTSTPTARWPETLAAGVQRPQLQAKVKDPMTTCHVQRSGHTITTRTANQVA